jgi:glucose-1-phosphate adenylyltransferase
MEMTMGYELEQDQQRFHVTSQGVVVIPKGMKVS